MKLLRYVRSVRRRRRRRRSGEGAEERAWRFGVDRLGAPEARPAHRLVSRSPLHPPETFLDLFSTLAICYNTQRKSFPNPLYKFENSIFFLEYSRFFWGFMRFGKIRKNIRCFEG